MGKVYTTGLSGPTVMTPDILGVGKPDDKTIKVDESGVLSFGGNAEDVPATDTHSLLSLEAESTTTQALLDEIADKVTTNEAALTKKIEIRTNPDGMVQPNTLWLVAGLIPEKNLIGLCLAYRSVAEDNVKTTILTNSEGMMVETNNQGTVQWKESVEGGTQAQMAGIQLI